MFKQLLERIADRIRAFRSDQLERLGRRAAPYLQSVFAWIRPYYEMASARYHKLEPRERLLVRIAALVVAIFLGYNLVYLPLQDLREGLKERVVQRQHELVEVRRLAAVYSRLKTDLASVKKRTIAKSDRDFSLFSVVEESITKAIGHDKIGSITPSDQKVSDQLTQYRVQLQLTNLSLSQVVDALYGIRSLKVPVAVSNLTIRRRFQDSHSYDVDMTCVAVGRNE